MSTRSSLRGAALGAWIGLGIAFARCGVLLAMERLAHGMDAELAAARMASVAPRVVATGLAIGLGGRAIALLLPASRIAPGAIPVVVARGALAVVVARGALAVVVAIACAWFWTGRLAGDPTRLLGIETARGLAATGVLSAIAVATAALLVLPRRAPRASSAPEPSPRIAEWLAVAAPLALALCAAFLAPAAYARVGSHMTIRTVVRDLLEHEPEWRSAVARDGFAPRAAVLCPSSDFRVRGGDLPALIVPPPGDVRFAVDRPDAPAELHLRAGISSALVEDASLAGHAVRFRVLLDGAPAFDGQVAIEQVGERPGTEWLDVPAIELMPGVEVALRTDLIGPDGEAIADVPRALDVGFGAPRLVRERERARETATPDAPNVILIVMDTLRADRTSAYGYARETTPALERLAARGLLYDQAISASSWTWPSTASILTGLHPLEHGVQDESSCHLAESLTTLPEVLQERGWSTAAWSANLLIVPDKGFAQGFEHFEHARGSMLPSKLLMPAALEWIERRGDERFFLYLQMLDPHSPLDPSPEMRARFAPDVPDDFSRWAIEEYKWDLIETCGFTDDGGIDTDACVPPEHQRYISDLYDACIASGDHWLGVLLDRLEALGLDENTVVIFTSDHGEEMFEHGQLSHSQCLFQGSVRVPLVMAGPGIPRGVVRERVANRNLAATIAALAGAPWPTAPDSLDLRRPDAIEPRDVLVTTRQGWWNGVYRQPLFGLLSGERALLVAPEGGPWGAGDDERTGDWALFDVTSMPERRVAGAEDRKADANDLAARMRADLERLRGELSARRATRSLEAGEGTLQMLKGIGYLGDE